MEKINPMDFLSYWDFIIMSLAIVVRMKDSMSTKKAIHKDEFSLSKYFDALHMIRWISHVCASVLAILVLPQLFVVYIGPKYMDGFNMWTLFGSAVIGYLGYDLVKVSGKFLQIIFKKCGLRIGFHQNK
jgi:hypothetical protein